MRTRHWALVALGAAGFMGACVGDSSPVTNDGGSDATTTDASGDSALDVATNDAPADAGPWTPADLDGDGSLALWLDANAQYVVLSNGHVGQWKDRSKNHNDATNTTTGPDVDPGVVNKLDAISFTSYGTTLDIPDSPSLQLGNDQFVIMAVAKDTSVGGLYFFSKVQLGFPCNVGACFYQGVEFEAMKGVFDSGTGTFPWSRIAEDTLDSGTAVEYDVGWNGQVFDDGAFHLVGLRRDTPGTWTLYADGQTQAATSGGFDVSQIGYRVRIGSVKYGNKGEQMNGAIAEIVLVHGAVVADSVVTNLQTYLKAKCAL